MEREERDVHFFVLLAQVQVIDSTITALIESHPDPDFLKERMQANYSLLLSSYATALIGQGRSSDFAMHLKRHMDDNLALLADEEDEQS